MNRIATLVSVVALALVSSACGGVDDDAMDGGSDGVSRGGDTRRSSDGEAADAAFAPGDCPLDSSMVEDALGIRSVSLISSFGGAITAPIPSHAPGGFDGPPIVYRYVCVFESPAAAVAVASSPPVPPVTRGELDDPAFAGVSSELLTPANDMGKIRSGWEHAADGAHSTEIQIMDRPEWGDGAFLVRIKDDEGPVDTWLYATLPGGVINIVINSAEARKAEPALKEPVEDAVDALIAAVGSAK